MIKIYQKNLETSSNTEVKNLNSQVSHVNGDSDPIDNVLNKYVDHSSILKIKKYFNEPAKFNFAEVIPNDI